MITHTYFKGIIRMNEEDIAFGNINKKQGALFNFPGEHFEILKNDYFCNVI